MNAGIIILKDGSPCIVYDGVLPYPVKWVEFSMANHQLTLVYDHPQAIRQQGKKFDFPLDARFVSFLKQNKAVAVARIEGQELVDIQPFLVKFVKF
jgi:hypothetical protein